MGARDTNSALVMVVSSLLELCTRKTFTASLTMGRSENSQVPTDMQSLPLIALAFKLSINFVGQIRPYFSLPCDIFYDQKVGRPMNDSSSSICPNFEERTRYTGTDAVSLSIAHRSEKD